MFDLKKSDFEVFPVVVPEHSSLKSINFYIIKQEHSLSLIDAGRNNKDCWNALNSTLKMNGYTINDLTEIILTHHHFDHAGLVNRITSIHPIPVYAHPESIPRLKRTKDFLMRRVEFYAQLYHEMGCAENGERQVACLKKALQDNEQNAIQADITKITNKQLLNFTVIEVPGHAPDQLAFYHKKLRWLFAGDLLIDHISSNALVEPDFAGNRLPALSQHIDSLKKTMALDSKLVFSGHGKRIDLPNRLILKRLERMKMKDERMVEFIRTGIATANDLAKTYYKNTYYEEFSLVMSEIVGRLDYLEAIGKVKKEMKNGVWNYAIKENGL